MRLRSVSSRVSRVVVAYMRFAHVSFLGYFHIRANAHAYTRAPQLYTLYTLFHPL